MSIHGCVAHDGCYVVGVCLIGQRGGRRLGVVKKDNHFSVAA